MRDILSYDENLWFEHISCEGKHYILGNPHTHPGRIHAWCPKKERSLFVSQAEMGKMSEQTRYWVNGFLSGNEPKPPTDKNGDVDFESETYKSWQKKVSEFHKTGYWEYEE